MSSDDRSWHGPGYPELRDGPPWVMEEMILAQGGLAEPILEAPAAGSEATAAAVSQAAEAGAPIVVTGCGTSEHGALAVAALLDQALRASGTSSRPEARQALDASLDPRPGGVCIGISHEGDDTRDDSRAGGGAGGRSGHGEHRRTGRLPACDRRRSRADDAAGRPLVVPHRGLHERHLRRRCGGPRTRGRPGGSRRCDRRCARPAATDHAAGRARPRRLAHSHGRHGRRSDHGARARPQDRGGRPHPNHGAAPRNAAPRPSGGVRRRCDRARAVRRRLAPGRTARHAPGGRRRRRARHRHADGRDRRRGGSRQDSRRASSA